MSDRSWAGHIKTTESQESGPEPAQADHCPAHFIDLVEELIKPQTLYPWQRELVRRLFQAGEL